MNSKKRPISAVADNIEVRNAKNIIIKTNKKIKFNLLYDKNRSLQKKIKIEQLRRETYWVVPRTDSNRGPIDYKSITKV